MTLAITAIIVGLIIISWSADKFVSGAAAAAKQWQMPPLIIGLTIVSIGTSSPEILVSIVSASQGHGEISVGNAVGSNIANIALVLGVSALVSPIMFSRARIRKEIMWLLWSTFAAGLCLMNKYLGLFDSLFLLGLLVLIICILIRKQKNHPEEVEVQDLPDLSRQSLWVNLFGGLLLLLASSQMLVWGAVRLAELLGVSELVIGLTIVAIGTSLPELAASVVSALRSQHDIALGNIAGSNIFNLLAVLAIPGLISPGPVDDTVWTRDYPVMLGLTVLLALVIFTRKSIGRLTGALFLGSYILYCVLIYVQSV